MEANRLSEPTLVMMAGPHSLRQGPGAVDEFVSSGGPLLPQPPPTRQRNGLHEQLFAASMYDRGVATMKEMPLPGGRLGMHCNSSGQHPRPFLYDVLCSTPLANADFVRKAYFPGTAACIISAYILVYAIPIAISVILKRRSARPGGRLYQYNQRKVHKTLSDKKRRLRDMLQDPVLVRDMERRYGDLSSLREKVQDWESDDFQLQKEEFVRNGSTIHLPWLREMTVFLALTLVMALYCEMNGFTSFVVQWNEFTAIYLERANILKPLPRTSSSAGAMLLCNVADAAELPVQRICSRLETSIALTPTASDISNLVPQRSESASLAHFADKLFIQRAATKRWGGGKSDGKPNDKTIVAAVGVPVPMAEEGVPLASVCPR